MAVAGGDLGRGRLGLKAQPGAHPLFHVARGVGVGPDRPRDLADRDRDAVAAVRRWWARASSNAQPASLRPNEVGSAQIPWVRPTMTVSRCSRARAFTTVNREAVFSIRIAPAFAMMTPPAVSRTSDEVSP